MKIVLDTNILISGIFWRGVPNRILQYWESEYYEIAVSPEILNEYVRVIAEIGKNKSELVKKWIDYISIKSYVVEIVTPLKLSRDPDDNKFLECAVSADADYVVSGDDDLLILKKVEGIPIIKASSFIRILTKKQPSPKQ